MTDAAISTLTDRDFLPGNGTSDRVSTGSTEYSLSDLTDKSADRMRLGSLRNKLIGLLFAFGLLPAAVLFGILYSQEAGIKSALTAQVATTAVAVNDVIDRNLFERYGDVQAFCLNSAAHDPVNWGRPGAGNPLVAAMNGYMTGYGIYKLMLLLGTDGTVLAVNSVDGSGKPLATAGLYGRSFAQESWFTNAAQGNYLEGKGGITGTSVEQPHREKLVADLYGADGFVIPFSAPVKDAAGKTIGVWVNFADFGLVEEIISSFYETLAKDGMKNSEITVLDPNGRILVDYDPVAKGFRRLSQYKRNFDVIGQLNLAEVGVEAAQKAVKGEHGAMVSRHARKNIVQAAGFAHSVGAYGYPGLGWSALVRIPDTEAFALWDNLIFVMVIAVSVCLAVITLAGLFIGNAPGEYGRA